MNDSAPIHHIPIEMGLELAVEPAGRLRLRYTFDYDHDNDEVGIDSLIAEFGVGFDFSRFVRITFEGPSVFRVLDEKWLSMATDSRRWTGDLTTFARKVVGDDFASLHEVLFELYPDTRHYQFVTASACLDVLSSAIPQFELVVARPKH